MAWKQAVEQQSLMVSDVVVWWWEVGREPLMALLPLEVEKHLAVAEALVQESLNDVVKGKPLV